MKAILLTASFALILTACQSTNNSAADSAQGVAQAANESGMICRNERETGSNMRVRVCRTPEQVERDREEAVDAVRNTTRGSTLGQN